MDQGNKQGLNSSKKKRMEKTSDDQEELLGDPLEQATKRFKAAVATASTSAQLLVAHLKRKAEKQALVLSTKESSSMNNNPKLGMNKETDSEETVSDKETETDQEEEVISLAGSSKNNPKGMKKKLIRCGGEEKKWKSNSLSDTACTSTLRILTKTRSPPGDQGSSCRKNL